MGIIAFIILGLLAGLIAKAIMPGKDPGGYIVTAVIGIVGALVGGFLAAALFGAHPLDEFFDISTWLTAIVARSSCSRSTAWSSIGTTIAHCKPDGSIFPYSRSLRSASRTPSDHGVDRAGRVVHP